MNKHENGNELHPVICSGYSTAHRLEIIRKFREIKDPYTRFRFISQCSGVELIIKNKRYWFEFFGKQITLTDIYIPNSSFALLLHSACT